MVTVDDLTAEHVIEELRLEPLEGEGVWIGHLWRNDSGNAIFGFLTPECFSALHRLTGDELWVHVAGAPIDMLMLHPSGDVQTHTLGRELGSGQTLAQLVPAGSWQGSTTRGDWALVTCHLAPPFSGFELADTSTDLSQWAQAQERISELIRG
jgi:uncharacterized protein